MATLAFSAPAYKGNIQFKQNDGSTFSGKLKGDEWFNWVENKKGDIIKYNKKSKNYEYGIIKEINGTLDLLPSGIKVKEGTDMSAKSQSTTGIQKINTKTLAEIWKQKRSSALKYKKHKFYR